MAPEKLADRLTLIDAVKTPLGFFALVVLVVEAMLGGLALASTGEDRAFLIRAIPVILVALVILVAAMTILRPEALWGQRYHALTEAFAEFLGNRVFEALDGSLSNLEPTAREEAYQVLHASIMSGRYAENRETQPFCEHFGRAIVAQARLREQFQALGRLPRN
jgi:hypothetical protein